jgi:hypothetical protein
MLLFLLACTGAAEDPCQAYVDYVCTCHAGDSGFDCTSLESQYESADAELQDECEVSLAELKAEDQDAGTGCSTGEDTAAL